MQSFERTYFVIDMKTFYASVECAERNLDPFTTPLVVADESRGGGALVYALTTYLKNLGCKSRCRVYEIPKDIDFIIAPPRIYKYIEYATKIYGIYLKYMSKDDIHVYSIDESFLDVTSYLKIYKTDAVSFAKKLMGEIKDTLHLTSCCGIGSNLYLAKVAADIIAKHNKDFIGILDEKEYQEKLWDHTPLTDFWRIGTGIQSSLAELGIHTMREITNFNKDALKKRYGVDSELLIDHAYGKESCLMKDIKAYKKKGTSYQSAQILLKDYTFEEAKVIIDELVRHRASDLNMDGLVCNTVSVMVGYSDNTIKPTGGKIDMVEFTSLPSILKKYAFKIYEETTYKDKPIRNLNVCFSNVYSEDFEFYGIFNDEKKIEGEKKLQSALSNLKKKMGKNTIVYGDDLLPYATLKERNTKIRGVGVIDEKK